ncbi:uncharacterized protein BYT42DRAFT_649218 [Radiomyces spectabilis]|uniref:uncharacterized protein n=1 Tax=Radiomyces spectabilis TaxID=64574 RepID=UPI00221E94B2|nr:uncharacterized protein BYT42DRAFT_649218 [Radiomyces spectabilis]KAI8365294.1 hypothetical protein BYT42DRAFT_649218 [Radiomyces spectabilis]
MKATFFLAIAAVFVATAFASHDDDIRVHQEINGVGGRGRVSGVLNGLLGGGILSDNSRDTYINQDAF